MKLKSIPLLLILAVLMVLLAGCGGGISESDIEATVEAKVEQAKASLVAPTAVPLPTYTPAPIPTPLPTYTPLPTLTPQVIIKEVVVTATPTPVPTATPTPMPTQVPTATAIPTAMPTPVPTATPTPINGPQCLVWEASGKVPDPTPTATSTPGPTPTLVILYPTATPINGISIPPPNPTPTPVIPEFLYIDLQKGWNLISFPTRAGYLSETSPDNLFYGTGVSTVMTTYDRTNPDEFGLPCVPQDHETNTYNKVALTQINQPVAYWVQARSEVRLELLLGRSGVFLGPTQSLRKGWNLFTVNSTPGSEVDTTTLLGNISWSQIIGYSQEDGTFTTILPDTGGILIGGLGYYIYMNGDAII